MYRVGESNATIRSLRFSSQCNKRVVGQFARPIRMIEDAFFSKNQTTRKAAIRLLPSESEWFLMTKYRRLAACLDGGMISDLE